MINLLPRVQTKPSILLDVTVAHMSPKVQWPLSYVGSNSQHRVSASD